ncbi:ABC transporter family protein [Clostridium sporogenes]|uniref:ABC transporter ATP-binding protein n=1 Tax=Clostridium TaxID=1485 RepID=UPI00090B715A|nr:MULTISPECIES: ABC transporter ATP-binding protein [Clostridium]APF28136.1 ABC transporter family protein [Clostridium sporogenes]MDI6918295.1 ABC transporter ATP-binding protein [Clostridium botulinum]WMU98307.1 ABC transporter ATP-binding protein [Clostridium botulinum]
MFKTIKRIILWSKGYEKRLYLGIVFSFLATCFTAGPTIVASWALNQVLLDMRGEKEMTISVIWISFLAIIVLILLRSLCSYWKAKLQESIGNEVAAEQRIHIGDILKRVSLGYFNKNSIGDILSTITTELSSVELQGMKIIDAVVNGYANLLAIVLCLAYFSWQAAIVSVIGALLSALALRGMNKKSNSTASINHKVSEDLASATIEYIHGLPIVKSFGQEGAAMESIRNTCKNSKDISIKIQREFVPFNCLHLFALKMASVGIVLVTGWLTMSTKMELPNFLMMAIFAFMIFGGVENINESAHMLGIIESALNKLEKIEKADYIDSDGKDIELKNYNINFEHVSFGYDERRILNNISFEIPENTTTAIVGPSGSGKSTLCNLISRFYDVNEGRIRVGGHDVRKFTCDSLLKNISMVFQNAYLFHDTIRNNILFGNPNATEEEIVKAAKEACCHDFIIALPDGYDTIVGERGSSLSGGEKQRISIARAILKNAPIVILDEATASIDPENEHLIKQAISALTHGKTIIIIAHRLATIEKADQILVVDGGIIVQKGRHEELINEEGVYKRFINIREKAEGWRII